MVPGRQVSIVVFPRSTSRRILICMSLELQSSPPPLNQLMARHKRTRQETEQEQETEEQEQDAPPAKRSVTPVARVP